MELLENPVLEQEIEQQVQQPEENYEGLSKSRKTKVIVLMVIFAIIYFTLAIMVARKGGKQPAMDSEIYNCIK